MLKVSVISTEKIHTAKKFYIFHHIKKKFHICLHFFLSVYWLNHDRTLMENGVKEDEVLLMKRKFYHSEDSMTKE